MKCTVIAIDGPAASGKSTISRLLAQKLDYIYLNTGSIYRAATWHVLGQGIEPTDEDAVAQAVAAANVHYELDNSGSAIVKVGEQAPTRENLTSDAVNAAVSAVSGNARVRETLLDRQRQFADIANLIAEGRDMGTRVFPGASYKFFVTASEEVRQKRRAAEGLTDDVARRDRADSTRKAAPLKAAEDAEIIDTSEMSIEDVLDHILEQLARKGLPCAERVIQK